MELRNGSYFIQNVKALDIVEEFGSPVYVYDAEKIIHQLKTLKTAFSDSDLKIKYAIKALSNLAILKLLKKNGAGADAVSIMFVFPVRDGLRFQWQSSILQCVCEEGSALS